MRDKAIVILMCAGMQACGAQSGDPPRLSPDPATIEASPPPVETQEVQRPITPPTDEQAALFARASNAFGFDLWSRVRTSPGNQIVSPASIAIALDMTYGGARAETAAQMARVLHVPSDAATLHDAAANVLSTWNDPSRDSYTLAVANRLFGERTFSFEGAFLELTRDLYRAPLEELDFAGAPEPARVHINGWVAHETRDRIRDLIPPNAITEDTCLVLTNAVYFLARWLLPFERSATRDAAFFADGVRSVQTPTMNRVAHAQYAEAEGVQILELPYRGQEIAMLIVLPRARDGLEAVEAELDAAHLASWTSALEGRRVAIALPKFRIAPEPAMALGDTLRGMGMVAAFDPAAADFTGIASPPRPADRLYFSQVFHKAFVQVDEDGTEAAAATAVVMVRGGAAPSPNAPTPFLADHPFLFFIRDLRSGAILFVGRLVDPTSSGS